MSFYSGPSIAVSCTKSLGAVAHLEHGSQDPERKECAPAKDDSPQGPSKYTTKYLRMTPTTCPKRNIREALLMEQLTHHTLPPPSQQWIERKLPELLNPAVFLCVFSTVHITSEPSCVLVTNGKNAPLLNSAWLYHLSLEKICQDAIDWLQMFSLLPESTSFDLLDSKPTGSGLGPYDWFCPMRSQTLWKQNLVKVLATTCLDQTA